MKIYSWNVNGVRAAEKKGFLDWLGRSEADFICLQETKAHPDQLEVFLKMPKGYQSHWFSAQKPGYSSVAIYTKHEPLDLQEGLGISEFDVEGRVLRLEFKDFHLISAYFPNSQRLGERLPYKLAFCQAMKNYCDQLVKKGKSVVLCGDYNIAHEAIDLRNPKQNEKNAGFLPEERAWMSSFLKSGYVDTFREFEKGPGHYSWWSYRPGVREKNIGWRLDYHCVNEGFRDRLKSAAIHPDTHGSDHCPVSLEIRD
jgi:exodeoxyribonuclease III